jgi:uncharacterized protein with PhoU and TrkA domain
MTEHGWEDNDLDRQAAAEDAADRAAGDVAWLVMRQGGTPEQVNEAAGDVAERAYARAMRNPR